MSSEDNAIQFDTVSTPGTQLLVLQRGDGEEKNRADSLLNINEKVKKSLKPFQGGLMTPKRVRL